MSINACFLHRPSNVAICPRHACIYNVQVAIATQQHQLYCCLNWQRNINTAS